MQNPLTGPEDRLAERKPIFLSARCRESSWVVRQVELADLSEGGCRIIGDAGNLAVGQEVSLRIGAGAKPISGQVRWIEDGDAGIEFAEALGNAVIDDLASTYSIAGSNVTDIRKYR